MTYTGELKQVVKKLKKKQQNQKKPKPVVANQLAKKARKAFQKPKPKPTAHRIRRKLPPGKTYTYQVTIQGTVEESISECQNVHPPIEVGPDGMAQCEKCKFKAKECSLKRHYVAMHNMRASSAFQCQLCAVFTTNRFDFFRHTRTPKHVDAVARAQQMHKVYHPNEPPVPTTPVMAPPVPTFPTATPADTESQKLTVPWGKVKKVALKKTSPKDPKQPGPNPKKRKRKATAKAPDNPGKALESEPPMQNTPSLPIKRYAQCMPMTPAEFARSCRLASLCGEQTACETITAVDGAEDDDSNI